MTWYAIITGASKGLGEAIAKRLLMEEIAVISVSRTENEEIKQLAAEKGIYYKHYSCNLSLEEEVQEIFMLITHYIFLKILKKSIYLTMQGWLNRFT